MKKIIILIILLALAVLIISTMDKKPKETVMPEPTDNPMSSSTMPVSLSGLNIANGSYGISSASSTSSIHWSGQRALIKVTETGTIGLKEVVFDVQNGILVDNRFVVDMNTLLNSKAKNSEDGLTTHLKSEDFFDVANFPTSTFVIKSLTASTSAATSSGAYIATGDLTIKGRTSEISIPVTFDLSKPGIVVVKGMASVDRTIWDVRYGSDKFFDNLGDQVIDDIFTLEFDLKLLADTKPASASTTPEQI